MNAKRLILAAGASLALAAALLPGSASADNRGHYGPHGYGYGYGKPWHGHGHGHHHHKPWKRGYYAYPRAVVVPAPIYAVPYPRFVPAPVYAPPPPVYYPPAGNDLTIIWRAGW